MKKLLSTCAALSIILTFTACDNSSNSDSSSNKKSSSGKTTLNIWAFTDEVPGMIDKYMELHPDFAKKYECNTTIIATTDGAYQPALDQALAAGGKDAG